VIILVAVLVPALVAAAIVTARGVRQTATCFAVDAPIAHRYTYPADYRRTLWTATGVVVMVAAQIVGTVLAFVGLPIIVALTGLGQLLSSSSAGYIAEGLILLVAAPTIGAAVGYLWFSRPPIDPRWTIGRVLAVVWVELVGLLVAPLPAIVGGGLLIGRTQLHGTNEVFAPVLALAALVIACAAAAAGPLLATRFRRTFATRATAIAFAVAAFVGAVPFAIYALAFHFFT
jgi:hypothetical protein